MTGAPFGLLSSLGGPSRSRFARGDSRIFRNSQLVGIQNGTQGYVLVLQLLHHAQGLRVEIVPNFEIGQKPIPLFLDCPEFGFELHVVVVKPRVEQSVGSLA
jgi:hypothetical protein